MLKNVVAIKVIRLTVNIKKLRDLGVVCRFAKLRKSLYT